MPDYTMNKAEIPALALAQTDAGAILNGSGDRMKSVYMSAGSVRRSRMSGCRTRESNLGCRPRAVAERCALDGAGESFGAICYQTHVLMSPAMVKKAIY
jgi:hypothetical protein